MGGLPSVIKSEPLTRTSIETIEKATAAHRASAAATSAKLAPVVSIPEVGKSFTSFSIPEVSPRPESSASGSMDSAELRIKEEMDDADLDQEDFDDDDSYSDEEKPAPKKDVAVVPKNYTHQYGIPRKNQIGKEKNEK